MHISRQSISTHQLLTMTNNMWSDKTIQLFKTMEKFHNQMKFQWIMVNPYNSISLIRTKNSVHQWQRNGSQIKISFLLQDKCISITDIPIRIIRKMGQSIHSTEFTMIWRCILFPWIITQLTKICLSQLLPESFSKATLLKNLSLMISS